MSQRPSQVSGSRVIGHRGAAGYAPENTLASLRVAHDLGVTLVEFDVRLTADGRCVLLHDDTLDRTTDGQGEVEALRLDELASLDAGSWFDPAFAGELVPTLDETIDFLVDRGIGANIELKASPGRESLLAEAVAELVAFSWPDDLAAPMISSFEPAALDAIRNVAPHLPCGLLVETLLPEQIAVARALGARSINCGHTTLDATRVREVRAAGFDVLAYTVNHVGRAEELFDWGVKAVFSDFPDRMLVPARGGPSRADGDWP